MFVHCLAHCTNLCLQTAGRQVPCVHDALDLVMGLTQLIRFTPKRSSLFETLQAQVSSSVPTLKPLCPTRWTVRTRAFDTILTNYHLLQDALEIIQQGTDEYASKAAGFLTLMERFSTYFGLMVSHLIFSATEQLSHHYRGKTRQFKKQLRLLSLQCFMNVNEVMKCLALSMPMLLLSVRT